MALTLASCAGRKHTASVTTETNTTTTITPRKVDIAVKGDTSGSATQLKVKDGKIEVGRKIFSNSSSKAAEPIIEVDTAGILNVKCPCLDQVVQAEVQDTEKTETKSTSSVTPVYVNELTDFQAFQIWCGRISLLLLGLYFSWKIFRTWIRPIP